MPIPQSASIALVLWLARSQQGVQGLHLPGRRAWPSPNAHKDETASPLLESCPPPSLSEPAPPHLSPSHENTDSRLSPYAHDVAAALLVPSVVPPLDSHPAAEGLGVLLLLPAVAASPRATHEGVPFTPLISPPPPKYLGGLSRLLGAGPLPRVSSPTADRRELLHPIMCLLMQLMFVVLISE